MPLKKTLETIASLSDFTILDVGARGGANSDFDLFAGGSTWVGFEPDAREAERLVSRNIHSQYSRSIVVDRALADQDGELQINTFSRSGSNSALAPRREVAQRFGRQDFFEATGASSVRASALDSLVTSGKVPSPSFMKLDVQGYELKILQGAKSQLENSVIGLRVECYFRPTYQNQPVFSDIEAFLRPYGFFPFGFAELHEWRRDTRAKPPRRGEGDLRFSRGQLIHGDILFFREPEDLRFSEGNEKKLVDLALASMAYEHVDLASEILQLDGMESWLSPKIKKKWSKYLIAMSRRNLRRRLGLP